MTPRSTTALDIQRKLYAGLGFLSLFAGWSAVLLGDLPSAGPAIYTAASLLSLTLYGIDKHRARRQAFRIPEYVLHLTELLCGWPGALIAQVLFRHKTQKLSFQLLCWLMIVLNLLLLLFLHRFA